jgi:hypothetical protein
MSLSWIHDSAVGILTKLQAGRPSYRGSIPSKDKRFFYLSPRPTLRPRQPPSQYVPRTLSLGLKWPEREVDATSLFTSQVKKEFSYDSFRSLPYDKSIALPKRVHSVQISASSISFQYPLVSLMSSGICLRLIPRLPVTSTVPSIRPSITCFKRQFLRQMVQTQLAFPLHFVCRLYRDKCTIQLFAYLSVQLAMNTRKRDTYVSLDFAFAYEILSNDTRYGTLAITFCLHSPLRVRTKQSIHRVLLP